MELCWRNLLTLSYWGWRLILRWPLKSTFALFSLLQLRGLVSWESYGKYFMIGRSYWDLFRALSCRFWSIVQQCGARLPLKLLDRVVRGAGFLAGGVLESNLAHRRSVECCACNLRLRVTRCILWAVHFLCRICRLVILVVLRLLVGTRLRILAVDLLSTVEPLMPSQCLFWNVLGEPVFDGVGLAGFKCLICSLFLFSTIYTFSSFHWLVVWGLGSSNS